MLKLNWPFLKVSDRIPGLIWGGTAYFVQNNTAIILPGDSWQLWAGCWWPIFGANLEARRQKTFHVFRFLQSNMVSWIVNPFSWKVNVISIDKSCLISMPFLLTCIDVRTVKFSPPAESWLVNSNFLHTSHMQGCSDCFPHPWMKAQYIYCNTCVGLQASSFGVWSA